jgi:hypothetical protein
VVELAGGRITIHWLSAKRSQLTGHSGDASEMAGVLLNYREKVGVR